MIHTVKDFGLVNEAEVDVFLELSCFSYDPTDVGHLISCSSAFSKSSLNICKFSVHILLKPSLENFEHYFTRVWDEYNCVVVWTFFGIAFLWVFPQKWDYWIIQDIFLKFFRILSTVFHNGCTNLLPHQQCIRIPFCPHTLQDLFFFFFLLLVILKIVRWHLTSHISLWPSFAFHN